MNIIGKTTIHPALFFSGKIAGYTTWVYLLYRLCRTDLIPFNQLSVHQIAATAILLFGLVMSGLSMFNLGRSTRLGLPVEDTRFKTGGLYQLSRNPMYVGFNLISIAAMVYTLNGWIVPLCIYSMIIYHLIILGEERFLEKRFGHDYLIYKHKVRRYI